jgi:uncharacterized protein YjbI with pentapeptide repeats
MAIGGARCGYTVDPTAPETWPPGVDLDPELVGEQSFPTCRREPLNGHDRCGLHLPPAERPASFDETAAVAERLRAVADPNVTTTGANDTASFVGARLSELDLTRFERALADDRLRTLDLRCAVIDGGLALPDLTLSQRLRLDHARLGRVAAARASFVRPVSLTGAHVDGDADPSATAGTGAVRFPNASFQQRLSMREATVEGNVSLAEIDQCHRILADGLAVDGLLLLKGTHVNEETRLAGLRCGQLVADGATLHRVTLARAEIDGETSLDRANLWGVADGGRIKLTGTTLHGPVSIARTTFHTGVTLRECTIGGAVDLTATEVQGGVDAGAATLHGPLEGPNVEIDGAATFDDARFQAPVTLRQATFHGDASFVEAVFDADASFDQAVFHAAAVFDGATFTGDVYYRQAVASERADGEPSSAPDAAGGTTEASPDIEHSEHRGSVTEPASDGGAVNELAPHHGIFRGDVSLVNTTVEGEADFRSFRASAADPFGPKREVVTTTDTIGGRFDAAGAVLAGVELAGFSARGAVSFRDADLRDANLRAADLQGAEAERVTLDNVNLFAASLDGAALHGAVFEGARIDDQTTFGDTVTYDRRAADAADLATRRAELLKAISLYSQLETLARENGQMALARTMFIGRKEATRRKQAVDIQQEDRQGLAAALPIPPQYFDLRYLGPTAKRYAMNYGESWFAVLLWSVVIVLLFGAVFPLLDLRHRIAGSISYADATASTGPITQWAVEFGYGILFSLASFTALGNAGFQSGSIAQSLAILEAGLGIVMFGLLLFVLQRRTAR